MAKMRSLPDEVGMRIVRAWAAASIVPASSVAAVISRKVRRFIGVPLAYTQVYLPRTAEARKRGVSPCVEVTGGPGPLGRADGVSAAALHKRNHAAHRL